MEHGIEAVKNDLVSANAILAHQGIVDAFGHVSTRHPQASDTFFLSRAISPELVGVDDIVEYRFDGTPVSADAPKGYLERFIHAGVYARRSDVNAVVHTHSRRVLPFCVTDTELRPIVHACAVIGRRIPIWDPQSAFGETNLLISNMAMADDFAEVLGHNRCALMRGHGSTVAGRSLREAVFIAIYLEANAEIQSEASRLGTPKFLTDREIDLISGRMSDPMPDEGYDRAWKYWLRLSDRVAR